MVLLKDQLDGRYLEIKGSKQRHSSILLASSNLNRSQERSSLSLERGALSMQFSPNLHNLTIRISSYDSYGDDRDKDR